MKTSKRLEARKLRLDLIAGISIASRHIVEWGDIYIVVFLGTSLNKSVSRRMCSVAVEPNSNIPLGAFLQPLKFR